MRFWEYIVLCIDPNSQTQKIVLWAPSDSVSQWCLQTPACLQLALREGCVYISYLCGWINKQRKGLSTKALMPQGLGKPCKSNQFSQFIMWCWKLSSQLLISKKTSRFLFDNLFYNLGYFKRLLCHCLLVNKGILCLVSLLPVYCLSTAVMYSFLVWGPSDKRLLLHWFDMWANILLYHHCLFSWDKIISIFGEEH